MYTLNRAATPRLPRTSSLLLSSHFAKPTSTSPQISGPRPNSSRLPMPSTPNGSLTTPSPRLLRSEVRDPAVDVVVVAAAEVAVVAVAAAVVLAVEPNEWIFSYGKGTPTQALFD